MTHVQVTTTHETREAAAELARAAVGKRLAACAQIDEIRSFYWWDGAVQDDPEWRVTLKTSATAAPELIRVLRREHSYGVPEIIATPITDGDADYLAWIDTETGDGTDGNA